MYANSYPFTGGQPQQLQDETFKQPVAPLMYRPMSSSPFNVVAPPRSSALGRSSLDARSPTFSGLGDVGSVPELVPDSPRSSLSSSSPPTHAAPPPAPLVTQPHTGLDQLQQAWPAYHNLYMSTAARDNLAGQAMEHDKRASFERASSVPVQTLPKPIRRRTQEWKDQQSFVPTYYGSQQPATDQQQLSQAQRLVAQQPVVHATALSSQQFGNGYTPQQQQQLLHQYQQQLQHQAHQQQQQQQQQQSSSSSLMWAPSTDHPLSLPEQQDLLDRVRRDLNGVDLDTIKGPLRALALAPQDEVQAGPGSLYAASSAQPAYGSAQAVEREREEMLRKTVSPQEAFLDYDDVDHRLSSPKSSSAFASLGASLFAPLPARSSPVSSHQLQAPRTPPLVSTVKLAKTAGATNGSLDASTASSAAASTSAAAAVESPKSSARKAHPFAVPQNAVSWVERTTSSGNLGPGDDMADFEKGGSSSDDPDDDGPENVDGQTQGGGGGGKTKADGSVGHINGKTSPDHSNESSARTTQQIDLSALPPLIDEAAAAGADGDDEDAVGEDDVDASFGIDGSDPLLADRYEVPPPPKSADMTPAFGFAPPPPSGVTGAEHMRPAAQQAMYAMQTADEGSVNGDGYVSARIPRPRRTTDADAEGEYYYFNGPGSDDDDDYYGAPPPPPHVRRASGVGGSKRTRTPGFGASSDDDGTFQDDDDDDAWGSDFGSRRRRSGVDKNGQPHKRRRRAPKQRNPGDPDAPGGIACPHVNADGSVCGTFFRRPYDLARHRETIHNEGQKTGKKVEWLCKECGGSFSRKDALIRHARIRNHRSGL
ncbi:hypothetical protein ACM66B_004747 [Microbotryomycetes sp. NB124-2]